MIYMEYYKKFMEKKHMPESVVSVMFFLYLVSGYHMPSQVASLIDTMGGKIIIAVSAIVLLAFANPILGVLGLFVAYELIYRSSVQTGSADLEKYYPTEEKKWSPFTPMHQFPYTLEQEVVKKMAPVRNSDMTPQQVSFKPILDNTHNAANINGQN